MDLSKEKPMRLDEAVKFFSKGTPLSVVDSEGKELTHLTSQITQVPVTLKYGSVGNVSINWEEHKVLLHMKVVPHFDGKAEDEFVNYSATSYRASCFNHYCVGYPKG